MTQILVFVGSIAFMLACLFGLALCVFGGDARTALRYLGGYLTSIGILLAASAVLTLIAWPVMLAFLD